MLQECLLFITDGVMRCYNDDPSVKEFQPQNH